MALMNLTGHQRRRQGQRVQTSRGGASCFSPRGLWGISYSDTSWNQKEAMVNQKCIHLLFIFCCCCCLLCLFQCTKHNMTCSQLLHRQTDVLLQWFSHPENMQFICIWKRFTGEKTNRSLSRSGECMWWATSENRNGVKLSLLLPPSFLTNGAAVERPLWVSCNFRQPLAGVGDLSSSQPSFSSASVSYLWPPSKVNVLPQVQINSSLTDQRPPLLLPLFHLNSHISYNRGN